jgi:hypothetical protein
VGRREWAAAKVTSRTQCSRFSTPVAADRLGGFRGGEDAGRGEEARLGANSAPGLEPALGAHEAAGTGQAQFALVEIDMSLEFSGLVEGCLGLGKQRSLIDLHREQVVRPL